jgi:thiamine-phosphate diphosphorylase
MTRIPRLHLISNREICSLEQLPVVVRAAIEGGVDAVHLREPGLSPDDLLPTAQELMNVVAGSSASFLINGHIDLAVRVGASGVHLKESQVDQVALAFERLGNQAFVGLSVHSVESAEFAESRGASYLIAGHVFETESKPEQAGRGLDFIRNVSSAVSIPVIGIGGITPGNAGAVLDAGAHGIAVLSGILAADDSEEASEAYSRAIAAKQGDIR